MQIFTLISSHRKYINQFKENVRRLFKKKYYNFVLPTDLELNNGRFNELFNIFGEVMKSIEIKNNPNPITKYRVFSMLKSKCPSLKTLKLINFCSNNLSFAHVFPLIKQMEIIEFTDVASPGFLMTFINKSSNLIELREFIGKIQPNLKKILLLPNADINMVTSIKYVNIVAPNVQELTLLDNHIHPSDRLLAHYNLLRFDV